jgi:hypothetical protein
VQRFAVRPGNLPRIGSGLRAQRLGFALRNFAAELVDERRKVALLRREIADLRTRLESVEPTQGGDQLRPAPLANALFVRRPPPAILRS